MAAIELRSATEDDYDFAFRVHRAAMRPYVERTFGWDEDFQARYFRLHFDPAKRDIIRYDDVDIGIFSVEVREESLFLAIIAILPRYQGLGIGTALLGQLQDRAKESGVRLTLQVLKVNPARKLYERLGFEVTGETETHYQMAWSEATRASS